ncbi:MAG: hypothetical protein NC411_08925 [Bacteroides sp.]|nr:hypothetical protein [Bacteroides sp.]
MVDEHLMREAYHLSELLDKQSDKLLPKEIADVVKLHSKLAVGSAWIPIPGADVAAGAATIWTMYGRINSRIGVQLKDNILKSVASGVATNLASYAAMSGVASAMKLIPGIGTVGGALVMSGSLYAITIASGWVYLKALCKLAEKDGPMIDMSKLGDAMKEILADSNVKNIIKQAKKEYKK